MKIYRIEDGVPEEDQLVKILIKGKYTSYYRKFARLVATRNQTSFKTTDGVVVELDQVISWCYVPSIQKTNII